MKALAGFHANICFAVYDLLRSKRNPRDADYRATSLISIAHLLILASVQFSVAGTKGLPKLIWFLGAATAGFFYVPFAIRVIHRRDQELTGVLADDSAGKSWRRRWRRIALAYFLGSLTLFVLACLHLKRVSGH